MYRNIKGDYRMNNPWEETTKSWPDPILLKDVDKLPGFPYSKGHIRNLVTGKKHDPALKKQVFHIGKFAAIRRCAIGDWLSGRVS
jgi:hypothetical protein